MRENKGDRRSATDPLADVIRAAGRRPAPPPEHYERVYAATHAVWQQQLRQRRRRWHAAAAAVAVLALGATVWQAMLTLSPPVAAYVSVAHGRFERHLPDENLWVVVSDRSLPEGARVRTVGDGSVALRLAQGGSLRIDNDTEIVLDDSAFELDTGRIYFDSRGRPTAMAVEFVTPLGTVRDIGTQFEIRTMPDLLRVRTRSGKITVVDSPAAQPLVSQRGEEIELSLQGDVTRREFAPDDPQWRWAEALAVAPSFDTPTVLAYLDWIAQETGRPLEFTSESVRIQAGISRFLGDPTGLVPSELLVTIAATSDFSYELTQDGSILIGRDDQLR